MRKASVLRRTLRKPYTGFARRRERGTYMPSTCSACFMNRGAALGPTRWAHTIGFDAPRSKGWRKPSTVLDCYTATAEECRGMAQALAEENLLQCRLAVAAFSKQLPDFSRQLPELALGVQPGGCSDPRPRPPAARGPPVSAGSSSARSCAIIAHL